MKTTTRLRLRAMMTMTFLLLAGAVLGVTADRIWLNPLPMEAMPLTVGAMSERLGLSPDQQGRLDLLLDSLHTEIAASAIEGPAALRTATAAAHDRIEAFLPAEARPAFRAWMREHHEQMMHRMDRDGMHRGMMGPGMMQPTPGDSPGRGMRRRP